MADVPEYLKDLPTDQLLLVKRCIEGGGQKEDIDPLLHILLPLLQFYYGANHPVGELLDDARSGAEAQADQDRWQPADQVTQQAKEFPAGKVVPPQQVEIPQSIEARVAAMQQGMHPDEASNQEAPVFPDEVPEGTADVEAGDAGAEPDPAGADEAEAAPADEASQGADAGVPLHDVPAGDMAPDVAGPDEEVNPFESSEPPFDTSYQQYPATPDEAFLHPDGTTPFKVTEPQPVDEQGQAILPPSHPDA